MNLSAIIFMILTMLGAVLLAVRMFDGNPERLEPERDADGLELPLLRFHKPGKLTGADLIPMLAITLAAANMDRIAPKLRELRDYFMDHALLIDRSRVNGDREHRLPGNVNMCFEGIEGESLLLLLDLQGICASSGSACTSGSLDPSHVLLAIGLPHEVAHGSLRLSFGDETTLEDVQYILEKLGPIVERLRAMSPLWERIQNENR